MDEHYFVVPNLCSSGDRTQGFAHARQTLYQLLHLSAL